MNGRLPEARTTRWQPLRVGLVELYYYDREEFWFEDGHLLLRGNNGTGKSKVLSLTLPFLLDASLSPARLEPDADPGKRMEWNLLMGGKYKRRTGYAWIEFGRLDEDGQPCFATLGAGLRATAGRPGVDSWFFVTDQRIGSGFDLVDPNQTVATQERLKELLGSHNVHATAREHRNAVDERLFRLGRERYRALIDTLIQLRQPQLSKRPNEDNLSRALSQAFAPLARAVLEDVADAMNQLDAYRAELENYAATRDAVARFNGTYRRYAQILARRRARTLRQSQTRVDNASAAARDARAEQAGAEAALVEARQQRHANETRQAEVAGQLEVLRASPEMRSAQELERARRDAAGAEQVAAAAKMDADRTAERQRGEAERLARRCAASEASRERFESAFAAGATQARAMGVTAAHADSWGANASPDALARRAESERRKPFERQRQLAAARSKQIDQIRKRIGDVEHARQAQQMAQRERAARADDSETAEAELAAAARRLEGTAQAHIADWQAFAERVAEGFDPEVARAWPYAAAALADWIHSLDGTSPLEVHWNRVANTERDRIAADASDLRQRQRALEAERAPLVEERTRLEEGRQTPPPASPTRTAVRAERAGAPLWQLVDFAPEADAVVRAGVEAALQASGLLDAWVTPGGTLLAPDTEDTWLVPRPARRDAVTRTLGSLLGPDAGGDAPVAAAHVEALLAGIALVEDDTPPDVAEAWIATDGRFRIGALQGAWHKRDAEYIGYPAREAARQRRLQEIAQRLAALAAQERDIAAARSALAVRRETLQRLADGRPGSDALRAAHAERAAFERRAAGARKQLGEAEARLQTARNAVERAQESLAIDAEDTGLPIEREALDAIAHAVNEYRLAIRSTEAALREHAQALIEQAEQTRRDAQARADFERATARASEQHNRARAARARHAELARSVGASVEAVFARLAAFEQERDALEVAVNSARRAEMEATRRLGAAEQAVTDTAQRLADEQTRRSEAVTTLQKFSVTGLLRMAAPALAASDTDGAWAIDAALAIARAAEAALNDVDDGDEASRRTMDQLTQEFGGLQRSLSAQGFECFGQPGDDGFVVRVTFNQRAEPPDTLQVVLENEISERRSLLTAKETEVIENHLQAEIADRLQQLIRAADARVESINTELAKRPTSTGVKFKLVWEPLPDDDGSLAHLANVRRLLLNRSHDAWSPADRAEVGAFLQGRISAERERDTGSARIDQLANALDYRAWHRFRVRRWQDGQWKPLSGPASSGERALGLTVPLFAAAASHYESAAPFAPRLVLLDEAFAGIDDGARAHCMGLIREFDLDFVMTSEREWGCYAELPGVSICHLVRRADIDAVYVSRWRWNGRRREPVALPQAEPEPLG
ncbi:MAG TPA: TIGR02680 family protein [Nevskiaceae bacterium]